MKNLLWVGLVVVLLVLGLIFWKTKGDSQNNALEPVATTTVTNSVSNSGKTTKPVVGMKVTLGGIFAEAGNHQCDYTQANSQGKNESVLYFSGGKMRGEFRTYAGEQSINTIMIYDGSYLYTWTEGKTTGTRTQPKTIKDLPSLIPEDITSGKILGSGTNNVSWNCRAWNKDTSKLVLPTYVKFN